MDTQRLLLFVGLFLVLFLLWDAWQREVNPPPEKPATSVSQQTPAASTAINVPMGTQTAPAAAPSQVPGSDEAVHASNAAVYEENKDLPLEDVRAAFKRSYTQALTFAEQTPDEVLFTENMFEGRKNPYWVTVASNTWWHYKDHYEDLTRWLGEQTGE